jgi:hypothetical protein
MKTVVRILIVTCLSFQLGAQDLEYGEVDEVDFTLEAKDVEEQPDAVVILKKVEVDFNLSTKSGITKRRTIHERIKINSEAGLEYATKSITLYMSDGSIAEKFKDLEAATYNLVDGKVKRNKLKKSGVFEEDVSDQYRVKSFTMPNVKIGSVIEYTYVIESPYPVIDDIVLQYGVPILNIDVKMVWLEFYQYQMHFNPRATYLPKFEYSDGTKEVTDYSVRRSGINNNTHSFNTGSYELKTRIVEFKDTDIPALSYEPMAGNLANYRSEIIVELTASKEVGYGYKQYSSTWDAISSTILDSDNFGGQINERRFFRDDLGLVIKDLNTDKEKIEAILQFVKGKVKWDGYYGKYANNGVKDAYKKGSGNVADVNLLLIAMFKEAGLEAFPVLVSTKDNGIPFYPTKDGFNYVIASVKNGDKTYLIDATDKHTALHVLPLRVMNWKGRLIRENGQSEWVDLFPNENSTEISLINGEFNQDGEIDIKVKKRLTEYLALNARNKYAGANTSAMQTGLKSGASNMEISNIETENMDAEDVPLSISYDGVVTNASEEIGGKLYITPLLHEANEENPFKLEKRKYPLDMDYPLATKTIVNLKIPEGYMIESLPESVKLVYASGLGSYTYQLSDANAMISIVVDFKLDSYLIEPENYQTFREFFSSIVSKDAEKIVLRKI